MPNASATAPVCAPATATVRATFIHASFVRASSVCAASLLTPSRLTPSRFAPSLLASSRFATSVFAGIVIASALVTSGALAAVPAPQGTPSGDAPRAIAPRAGEVRAPLPAPRAASTAAGESRPASGPSRSLAAQALASQEAAPARERGDATGDPGSLFAVADPEPRAFAVHDLVTIVVSESSRSKSAADAKAEKDYELSGAVDAWVSMDPTTFGGGFFTPLTANDLPAIGVQGDKYFRGKGNYARSDDFTARVTAEVVEVRPNGLLVLEARREIQMDGETQVITLSGLCRPDDVDASNQVLSQRVADAVIRKTTTGQLRDTAEKGVLAKLLDAIFAF